MKTMLLTAFALVFAVSTANAQQTFFRVRIDNVAEAFTYPSSGVFNTPEDSTNAGPLGPGAAYEFTFDAPPGASLSFATMFVPSNDLFFAPDENGIALWNPDGTQVNGDVTAQVLLWMPARRRTRSPASGRTRSCGKRIQTRDRTTPTRPSVWSTTPLPTRRSQMLSRSPSRPSATPDSRRASRMFRPGPR